MFEGAINDDSALERVSNLFGHLEENPPTDRIKKACQENQHRAGGKLLDRSKYMPNPSITPELKELARAFSKDCIDAAWESEIHPFSENEVFRWVTNKEITIKHLRNLVHFYSESDLFKNRIIELHTGAHCTEQGVIGTSEPKFSLSDA